LWEKAEWNEGKVQIYSGKFTMAPNLAASQHDMIRDMILSKSLRDIEMAAVAGCSDRSVRALS
jgi:hypothetical protein